MICFKFFFVPARIYTSQDTHTPAAVIRYFLSVIYIRV